MAAKDPEAYRRLSRRAGIVCSASALMFVGSLSVIGLFQDSAPRWIGIPTGLGVLSTLISGAICIVAAAAAAARAKKIERRE